MEGVKSSGTLNIFSLRKKKLTHYLLNIAQVDITKKIYFKACAKGQIIKEEKENSKSRAVIPEHN